jgi:hypothetical protein
MRDTGDRIQPTQETQFRVLLSLFPDLRNLVEDLDLIDPYTGMRYPEEEQKVISSTDRIKLRRIAEKLLTMGRVYTPEQVISLIGGGLNIERQRAINGFKMMLSSGVLTLYSGNGIRLS